MSPNLPDKNESLHFSVHSQGEPSGLDTKSEADTMTRVNSLNDEVTSALPANGESKGRPFVPKKFGTEAFWQQALEQMSNDQKEFFQLVARNLNFDTEEDIATLAERLWSSSSDAWTHAETVADTRLDRSLGREFLNCLLPWGTSLIQVSGSTELMANVKFTWRIRDSTREVRWFAKPNLDTAFDVLKEWLTTPDLYSLPWDESFLPDSSLRKEVLYQDQQQWPKSWRPNGYRRRLGNNHEVNYSTSHGTFDDLLEYRTQIFDDTEVMKELSLETGNESSICGVIGRVSIDRTHSIIDLETIATILCLGQGPRYWPYGGPQFLHAHIAEWSNKPLHTKCRTRIFQSSTCEMTSNFLNPGSQRYGVFMHYMRSFTVVSDAAEDSRMRDELPLGLKCSREWISFQGFYGQGTLKLAERRFSTTLSMLPILKPLGHYVLLSIIDTDQRMKDEDPNVWRGSPAWFDPFTIRVSPWKKYGLYPAGIYTGMAVFQLQICAFVDTWEADWNDTIDHIDDMVSIKLHTLRDLRELKTLVLVPKADKSVLYFQVLQILRLFSDCVRAAPPDLEALSDKIKKPSTKEYWFESTYRHMNDTHRVLDHNWCIVHKRQRDAADRLLVRLERTINEVKGLRDGLFSTQSVAEAQKTRVLSKHLLVFTIVTILFLPPTFVATLFGVDMFSSAGDDSSKAMFWVVMGGVSGLTYLIAALGLFGTSVLSGDREEWAAGIGSMPGLLRRRETNKSQSGRSYSDGESHYPL